MSRLPGLVYGGLGDAKSYQPGPPPLHILHRTAGTWDTAHQTYAAVIAYYVHIVWRHSFAITAAHPELNLRKPVYEAGEKRGPLQNGRGKFLKVTLVAMPSIPLD